MEVNFVNVGSCTFYNAPQAKVRTIGSVNSSYTFLSPSSINAGSSALAVADGYLAGDVPGQPDLLIVEVNGENWVSFTFPASTDVTNHFTVPV